jgi:hypothetical protein
MYPDRLTTLLGNYRVGTADCLTDRGLVALAQAQNYRRQVQARMKPIDSDGIKKLPVAQYHVSRKIDGEFNCLVYQAGEAILVNPGGTVRVGLDFLDEIANEFTVDGIHRTVIAGELWFARPNGRERVHDVTRVARCPESEGELARLAFSAFDIIEWDGQIFGSFQEMWSLLDSYMQTPHYDWLKTPDEIMRRFNANTSNGYEGIVLRSDLAGSYKVKPRHSIDAVVIGYTEREARIHDLLVALMRPDGTYQILGRVGTGFSDQERRNWHCDLQELAVECDYIETNDGVAYQMVWPRHVIEISVLDLITNSTRGAPIASMCLCWQTAIQSTPITEPGPYPKRVTGVAAETMGHWRSIRKMPLAAMISPVLVGIREDKSRNPADLRLTQVTDLVEVQGADTDPRELEMPKIEVLRREVFTKQLKGKTMVRKLVMWATHKSAAAVGSSSAATAADFPAYVIHLTDYSPDRAEPLQRDIRVSNSREQIAQLWEELVKEKVVKGWVAAA